VFKLDEGSIDDANLLGNRGATLCDMKRYDYICLTNGMHLFQLFQNLSPTTILFRNELPVPASLIITTEACQVFVNKDK
jgi:phosphoenolpyruvate synthase/pyruvate phosphate dikinase